MVFGQEQSMQPHHW